MNECNVNAILAASVVSASMLAGAATATAAPEYRPELGPAECAQAGGVYNADAPKKPGNILGGKCEKPAEPSEPGETPAEPGWDGSSPHLTGFMAILTPLFDFFGYIGNVFNC